MKGKFASIWTIKETRYNIAQSKDQGVTTYTYIRHCGYNNLCKKVK